LIGWNSNLVKNPFFRGVGGTNHPEELNDGKHMGGEKKVEPRSGETPGVLRLTPDMMVRD